MRKLVTPEKQINLMNEYRSAIRERYGILLECREERISLRSIIATQPFIEEKKFNLVLEKVKKGTLRVPPLVEEHFEQGRQIYYLVDGHCRVRALLELGIRYTDAFVLWYPGGEFESGLIQYVRQRGSVRIHQLPIR